MTAGSDSAPIVRSYDFKHPARVSRDQMRVIEALHENGTKILGSTLSGVMRAVVDVEMAFIDQTTYREFIASLSNPSASYQFTLGPMHGGAVMDFELPLVYGLVDRIFGGKGSSAGIDGRQMTQMEMFTFAKVVIRAIADLEALWEPVIPDVNMHDIELDTNPEFMQVTADNEIVVLVALQVKTTNMSGLIRLCYPFFTLEPVLPRLAQTAPLPRGRRDRTETRARNRLALGAMDLPAVVELGRTRLSVGSAQSLRAGDVIRLDACADDPACIFVGGKPRFLGFPCALGDGEARAGNMGVQIAGRVPPAQAIHYGEDG